MARVPTPVAITGLGAVSPAGWGIAALWQAVLAGKPLAQPCRRRDLSRYRGGLVTELESFPSDTADPDPCAALAVDCACQAVTDADVVPPGLRSGVAVATTTAGWTAGEDWFLRGGAEPRPDLLSLLNTAPALSVARRFSIGGPSFTVSSACASALAAIGLARDALLSGDADLMIVGGVDVLVDFPVCGFSALRLTTGGPCRPFSRDRRDIVLGEGSAFMVMETMDHALGRGARIRCVIAGYGESCDAVHLTAPDPDGMARAIMAAVNDAAVEPGSVDAVFAHGTGSPANDRAEASAVARVFADRSPAVTAIKGTLGHQQGAAGAFTAVVAALSLTAGTIPPTAGCSGIDPEFAHLDLVTAARTMRPRYVLANAFGFGGVNASVVLTGGDTYDGNRDQRLRHR